MSGKAGASGPRFLPTAIKDLNGTARADRANPDEPVTTALAELPKPPSYLSAMSKTAWRRIGTELVEMEVLTSADLTALEAYCVLYAHWRTAEVHLKKSLVVTRSNGVVTLSPYMRVSKDCLKEMKSWMLEFGLTPSSRSRVKVEKKEPPKPEAEDWFNEHRN